MNDKGVKLEQRITLPQWIAREKDITRDVIVEGVVRETAKAAVVTLKPVYSAGADHCHRCYRELTHPVSMVVGFGPECCAHLGLPRPTLENAEEWIANAEETLGDTSWEVMLPKSTLFRAGFEFPESVEPVAVNRKATLEGSIVRLAFDYDANLVSEVKALRNRKYDPSNKTWTVNIDQGEDLLSFLHTNGFEFSSKLAEALMDVPVDDSPKYTISSDGSEFIVRFPYEYHLKEVVKALPAKFNGDKADPAWVVKNTPKTLKGLKNLVENCGFVMDSISDSKINDSNFEQNAEEMKALSSATETDFEVAIDGLHEFQKVAVEYITKAKRVVVGDTMGLGKTVEALAAAETNDAYPMLVICPASLKYNWLKEVQNWLPHRSAEVLNGQTGNYDADITIINYDILANGWQGKNKDEIKKSKKQGKFLPTNHTVAISQMDLKMVVMDEGHYVKEKGAQRSRATKYLSAGTPSGRAAGSLAGRNGVEYRVWMSGTPVLNRPAEIIYPLEILDRLDELGGFNEFTYRYCDRRDNRFGMDIRGSSNEAELNNLMRSSFYIRRTKADVLDELPNKEWADQYIHIDNREEYDFAEDELIEYVAERAKNNPDFLDEISELEDNDQDLAIQAEGMRAAGKAEQAEVLVRLGNLRRLTAEGKLNSSIAWIEDFLKSGEQLIVFANHRKVVNAIADHFNAPKIMGGMNAKKIEEGKEAFQSGEAQLIVLNIQAGGVGHTLTAASHVCFVEFPWNPGQMDQAIDRAYARMNDLHGVTVWQIIAEDTMDQTLISMINQKRLVVEAVTEGREKMQDVDFMKMFMEERS